MLCFEEKEKKRKMRETIEIIKHKNTLNIKTDLFNLNSMYSPVFSTHNRRQLDNHFPVLAGLALELYRSLCNFYS